MDQNGLVPLLGHIRCWRPTYILRHNVVISTCQQTPNTSKFCFHVLYVIFHFDVLHACFVNEISRQSYSLIIILNNYNNSGIIYAKIHLINMDKVSEC